MSLGCYFGNQGFFIPMLTALKFYLYCLVIVKILIFSELYILRLSPSYRNNSFLKLNN